VDPNPSRSQLLPLVLSYLAVYVIWGSTYFFIRLAVETISPYLIVGVRFSLGGLVLLAAALAGGRLKEGPDWRRILSACLLGALLLFGANGLVTVAEQTVDSYLVALILASVPLAVALFDRVLFGKRVSAVRLGGILLGVAGVGVLLYRGAATFSVHTVLVLAATALWAFATSLSHRLPLYADSLSNAAIEMLCAGVLSLAVFAASGHRVLPELLAASPRSLLGLGFLTLFGSLAFTAYTYLLAHQPAIRIVSHSLINPVIATLLGLLIGGETVAPLLAAGLPMVIVGLAIMLYGDALLARISR
jgi:drug/metabolite transporter (DMT)-like permease